MEVGRERYEGREGIGIGWEVPPPRQNPSYATDGSDGTLEI